MTRLEMGTTPAVHHPHPIHLPSAFIGYLPAQTNDSFLQRFIQGPVINRNNLIQDHDERLKFDSSRAKRSIVLMHPQLGDEKGRLHPESQEPDDLSVDAYFNFYRNAFDHKFGKGWREKAIGYYGSEAVEAGWGHMVFAACYGMGINRVLGQPVYMYGANELVSPEAAEGFQLMRAYHYALQHGKKTLPDIMHSMKSQPYLSPEAFKKPINQVGVRIMHLLSKLVNAEPDKEIKKPSISDKMKDLVYKGLTDSPLAPSFFHVLDELEKKLMGTEGMADELLSIRKELEIIAAHTAHPATVKGSNETVLASQNVTSDNSDPGMKAEIKNGKLRTLMGVLFGFLSGTPQYVTDTKTQELMRKLFGKETHVVGSTGNIVDKEKALERWKHTSQSREILISTSGNGSSVPEIAAVVKNFLEYKEKHGNNDTLYTPIVFVGEHEDSKIQGILDEFNDDDGNQIDDAKRYTVTWNRHSIEDAMKFIDENRGKLIMFKTEDVILTALMKARLQERCVVELVKPGESPLINPNVGTVSMLFPAAAANEEYNAFFGALNGGSLFAGFTKDLKTSWSQSKVMFEKYIQDDPTMTEADRSYSLKKLQELMYYMGNSSGNVFEDISHLFGDTYQGRERGHNVLRESMIRGMVNIKNGTLAAIAMNVAHIAGTPLDSEFYDWLDELYETDRLRTIGYIEQIFPNTKDDDFNHNPHFVDLRTLHNVVQ